MIALLERHQARIIAASLYVLSLTSSVYYAFQKFTFVVDSDSWLEYQTYLIYVDEKTWRPIIDNILSSCLWTTYLPALIQNVVQLENTETVYRLIGAIVVSFAPVLMFMLFKRYTNSLVALLLSGLFFTSFFYQGFTTYARMHVAISFVVLLLFSVTSENKWKYLGIGGSIIGLLFSHYTVANAYTILVASASVAVIGVFYRHRVKHGLALVLAGVLLVAGVSVWYHTVPSVWKYSSSVVVRSVTDYGSTILEPATTNNTSASAPSGNVTKAEEPKPEEEVAMIPIVTNFVLLSHNRMDFRLAKLLIVLRMALAGAMVWDLRKTKRQWNAIWFLYALIILINVVTLWSDVMDISVGYTRASFIFMPLELLGVAYWWGEDNRSQVYLLPLIFWYMIYH